MSSRDKEKYYWLKLDRNFFKRHDIRILEDMPDGKEYVLFYLKLMTEAIDHEGELRFSETLPYTEAMLSSVTGTKIDVVRSALMLFTELGLVEIEEDQTLYLREVAKLLDGETYAAKRKREQKANSASGGKIPRTGGKFPPEKEIEKDIELEKETELESDKEKDYLTEPEGSVRQAKDARRIMEAWNALGLKKLVRIPADSKRGTMLRARIREYGTDAVLEAIAKVKESSFLKGQNAGSWVITFDWLIKPNNFIKVLEGNYDNVNLIAGNSIGKNTVIPPRIFVPTEL